MIDVPYAVKRALKDGNRPKQYRFQVLNDDETVDFTIDNDTLVKESVKIDERMCSGDRLKFGLCEGASLEFQYFNHPNIRGRRVKVYLDVAYDNEGTEAYYPLSMGYFDVDQCSTQFSTGIIKAVGYNKLRSDYLDEKCNDIIIEAAERGEAGRSDGVSIGTFLQDALSEYAIEPDYQKMEQSDEDITQSTVFDPPVILWKKNSEGEYVPFSGSGQATNNTWLWMARTYSQITYSPRGALYDRIMLKESTAYDIILEHVVDRLEEQGIYDTYIKVDSTTYVPVVDYIMDMTVSPDPNITIVKGINEIILGVGQRPPNAIVLRIGEHPNNEITRSEYLYDGGYTTGHIMTIRVVGDVMLATKPPQGSAAEANIRLSLISASDGFARDFLDMIENDGLACAESRIDTQMEMIAFNVSQAKALPDVTLRELQSAVYETSALYGQLDRDTDLFYGVELNSGSLTPSASLYPSVTLYPNNEHGNNIFRPFPSEYQKLWTDSVGEQTFRYLIITYKAIEYDQQGNPTEVDKTLQRTVHEHGTTNYNCSDNWLFRNLVWTAEQVGAYADAMVEKMLNIRWFPFEMWSTGLPYVEVGDAIEIADKEGDTHISYVLQRQLNGIQNLQDTYINGTLDIF